MQNKQNHNQSQQGYMRLKDILTIIPVARSTWWLKVKQGVYPQPVKLSASITAWKKSDIYALLAKIDAGELQ